jgi:hypothetical protein
MTLILRAMGRSASLDVPVTLTLPGGTAMTRMDETPRRRVRQDRRSFIREHHPDRGGDPDVFIAGLRSFHTERSFRTDHDPNAGPLPRVIVVRRRPWPARLAAAAQRIRHGPKPPRVR